MINFKLIIIALAVMFLSAKCDTQNNKEMENSNSKSTELKEIIVDVRSVAEWNEDGHADCSVNYPIDSFDNKIEELKKYDKIILVCRSGNRAGMAKAKLQNSGYTKEIQNLGAWQNVSCSAN